MAKHIHIHVHDMPIEQGVGQQVARHVAAQAVSGRDYGVPGMKKGRTKIDPAVAKLQRSAARKSEFEARRAARSAAEVAVARETSQTRAERGTTRQGRKYND